MKNGFLHPPPSTLVFVNGCARITFLNHVTNAILPTVTCTHSPSHFVFNEDEVCLEIGANPQTAIALMQRMSTNALPSVGDTSPSNHSPPPPGQTKGEGLDPEKSTPDPTPTPAAVKPKAKPKKKEKPPVSRLQ